MAMALGIDGGGTKTFFALAGQDGTLLSTATLRGTNLHDTKTTVALTTLRRGVTAVCRQAGVPRTTIGAVSWGAAGVDLPQDHARYVALLKQLRLRAALSVHNDVEAAFRAAFRRGQDGILLNAGTGSIAYGRKGKATRRAGGWGDLLGDEGSAYAIGLHALRAVVRAEDGRRPPTLLGDTLPRAAKQSDMAPLLSRAMGHHLSRSRIAALAPAVAEAAALGDPTAKTVLKGAAHDLADLVMTVRKGLGMRSPVHLCLMGGAFKAAPVLEKSLLAILACTPGKVLSVPPRFPPQLGPVILALELMSPLSADQRRHLGRSLTRFPALKPL